MPYLINKTSGAKITTVQDGTIDSSSLDITLVGKNFTGYGEVFNENFVKMLEHFSSNIKPVKPLTGQLWYDSGTKTLKLFTGIGTQPWKSLGILESSNSRPVGNNAGDLWFSPTEGRLYAYSGVGSNWILVGPLTTRLGESGALEYTALKEGTGTSVVVKLAVDGRQPAIFSPETFSVDSTDPIYTSDMGSYRFIKKGLTLGDMKDNTNGVSFTPNTGGSIVWGTSASALGMVRNDDVYYPADSFLLTAALASLPNKINLTNDEGTLIGSQGIMKLHVTDNIGNVSIIDKGLGDRVAFNINIGSANSGSNVISITTASSAPHRYAILPNSTATIWIGTDSQRFSYGFINTLTSSDISGVSISGENVFDSGNRVLTSVSILPGIGLSGGGTITGPSNSVTLNNTGVLNVAGTANQISVSTSTGSVVFSLPQNIDSNAYVSFAKLSATTVTSTEIYDSNARVLTTATIGSYGVSFIQGTTNQVSVSGNRGSVTLSLPQSIAVNSNVQFGNITASDVAFNKILVGTATGGSSGQIRASGEIYAYATSDRSFKEHVREIPDALNKAVFIGGKLFDWTDEYIEKVGGEDGFFVRKNDVGVIAQDVLEVMPEAVRTRDDGTLAVDYPKLCALAFAAIKELKDQLDQLRK